MKISIRIFFVLILAFLATTQSKSQESEFYQRYLFSQVTINPAHAGSAEKLRLGVAGRNQWVAVNNKLETDRFFGWKG